MRSWNAGDDEPTDRPPVVDDDGATWMYAETVEEGWPQWTRMQVTRHPGGAVVGYRTAYDWEEMLDEYGPLREASPDEAQNLTVTFPAEPAP